MNKAASGKFSIFHVRNSLPKNLADSTILQLNLSDIVNRYVLRLTLLLSILLIPLFVIKIYQDGGALAASNYVSTLSLLFILLVDGFAIFRLYKQPKYYENNNPSTDKRIRSSYLIFEKLPAKNKSGYEFPEVTLTGRLAFITIARTITFAMSFVLPLILVRTLSQMNFGLYKQVFLILTSAVALPGLGLSTSAYYFMPRKPDKKAQIAMNVLIFYFLVGTVIAIFFAVYPGWVLLVFKEGELMPYIPLLGLACMLWLLSSFLETVTVADGDIRSAFIFSIVLQIAKVSLLLMAGAWLGSIQAIVWAAVIQGLLQCLILFFYLRKRYGRFWRAFDTGLFKVQLAYALPFGLSGLAATVQGDLHNYFVSHYFDPAMFAIYTVGCFQLPLLLVLLDSVGSVIIPEFAKLEMQKDHRGIIHLWFAAVRRVAFFFLPACGLLLVMRHEFITALFTKNYLDAIPVFVINLLYMILFINLTGAVILAFDDLKFFRLKLYLSLIPVTGLALYFGIKAAGLIGAITAVAVVRIIDITAHVAVLRRRLQLSLSDLRLLEPMWRIAAAVGIASIAALTIKPMLAGLFPLLQLITDSLVFLIFYLIGAFWFGAVIKEEKDALSALGLKIYLQVFSFYRQSRVTRANHTIH